MRHPPKPPVDHKKRLGTKSKLLDEIKQFAMSRRAKALKSKYAPPPAKADTEAVVKLTEGGEPHEDMEPLHDLDDDAIRRLLGE